MYQWLRTSLYLAALLFSLGICSPYDMPRANADEENSAPGAVQPEAVAAPAKGKDADANGAPASYLAADADGAGAVKEEADEDPWEPFNEKMFSFNREVFDRFLLKPVATVWNAVLPDPVQRSIHNALDNVGVVPRLVNNIFQLRMAGAGREFARFTINSTIGVAGLFDVAKEGFGIEPSERDAGQTMGVYGMGPGPYLVLPFLPVMTVRDGIGMAVDAAMNPLDYFIPIAATAGMYGTNAVNERSQNLDKYERVEESVVDLYSAVRNAYLQRREASVKEP